MTNRGPHGGEIIPTEDRPVRPDPVPRMSRWAAEFPVGASVHHTNQLWTAGWTDTQRQANPQWGWGTVLEVETRHAEVSGRRGDLEVLVRSDAPHFEGGDTDRWWPAWLIDEVRS